MKHPDEDNLALLAGGETGTLHRFFLDRHVRDCEECQEKVADFQDLRRHLAEAELPDMNWSFLEKEMGANIRLGLEAGACVRDTHVSRNWLPNTWAPKMWSPRFAVVCASLLMVVGASVFFTDAGLHRLNVAEAGTSVLEPTRSGIELRKGGESFAFVGRQGARMDETVSAQGAIEMRNINDETGSVTINRIYVQQ
jgi:hypothetical protein